MECNRITELQTGVILVQKCSCIDCANRKNDTKAFYERFDLLYQQYTQDTDIGLKTI